MKLGIGIGSLAFIIFLFIVGGGSNFYHTGGTYEELENRTNAISWENVSVELNNNVPVVNHTLGDAAVRIIYKYIDFVGFTGFEAIKTGFKIGYDNPQYDYTQIGRILLTLVVIGICLPLVIPIIVLCYLIFLGIKWIIKRFT